MTPRHAAANLKIVRSILLVNGMPNAAVRLGGDGRDVVASIPVGEACAGAAGTAGKVEATIRHTVTGLRSLKLTVAGTRQSLATYASSRCSSSLPGGGGRVVLTQRGSGLGKTKTFTIRSPRWSIDYEAHGKFFQVIPFKQGRPDLGAFNTMSGGSGSRSLKGPGTFRLQVGGTGPWTLRVRDGA